MNQQALLKKAIMYAKTGDMEAFQNLYILTVSDTYGKVCSVIKKEREAEDILVGTYVMLYRRVYELPEQAEALDERISQEIERLAYKKLGINVREEDFYNAEDFAHVSEGKAAALWLQIEEKAGIGKAPELKRGGSSTGVFLNTLRLMLAAIMLCMTVFVVYKGWGWLNGSKDVKEADASVETTAVAETSSLADIVIEKEQKEFGWEKRSDGNLYYITKAGEPAEGTLAIGKQLLTFSTDGVLTFIGSNSAVTDNLNVSFDEDIRYEVRDGDVYKKAPDSQEVPVTKNGHVVQADVCGSYLGYICKYQIPNSKLIKTTLYRADLNGENQEELYTTDSTLNADSFQLTSDWLYYISDGMLLRRNFSSEAVELLAEQTEHYFAWEDTAYYMNGRELISVSEGTDYSGIQAGFKIEKRDNGFVLLDAIGEPVTPDENGEKQVGDRSYRIENGAIVSVRPAVRESNGAIYYIETSGSDKKIYSSDSTGSQGLIRQDGISVDSLCIAGEWLYYSARAAEYGGEVESRIYRLNLQTLESEEVGNAFRGYMRNLYYFENQQKIYGEYISSLADPTKIQGEIAVLSVGGTASSLNDTGALPETENGYVLELVMADGDRVYCLYHEAYYNTETKEIEYTSSNPIEIELN